MPTNVKIKGINVIFQGYTAQDPKGGETWNSTYNWAGWQKPCIDLAASLGANCVKTYSPINMILAGGSTATLGLQRMSQWLSYAQSKGLLVYFSGIALDQLETSPTVAQLAAAVAQVAAVLDRYPNVVGLDVINEINGTPYGADYYSGNNNLIVACSAAVRAVSSLPITFSTAAANNGGWANQTVEQIAAYSDFIDIHPYYSAGDPQITDLAYLRAAGYRKPILIGECGQAGGGQPQYAGIRTSRMASLGALAAQPDVMGAVAFCLNDYNGGVNYGFTDANLTTPCRTDYTAPFATWPAVQ